MPVKAFPPGYVLRADDVNQWMVPLSSWKQAPTPVNTDITPSPDPDLLISFPQAGSWVVESVIRYKGPSGNTLAFQWQTSGPGISGWYSAMYINSFGNLILEYQPWTFTGSLAQTLGTGHSPELAIRFNGLVTVGGAGSLAFSWAQGTSSGTNTTVDTGSYLIGWRAA